MVASRFRRDRLWECLLLHREYQSDANQYAIHCKYTHEPETPILNSNPFRPILDYLYLVPLVVILHLLLSSFLSLIYIADKPKITVERGKWYRMRMVMSSVMDGLAWTTPEGCELQLLAKDGMYVCLPMNRLCV